MGVGRGPRIEEQSKQEVYLPHGVGVPPSATAYERSAGMQGVLPVYPVTTRIWPELQL